jgi:feruloyl esterase
VHGTDDTLLSHYDTARTFLEMTEAAGGKGRDNAKFYTVAGMGHCYGGPGADTFDMVTPLTQWVEQGIKPGTIIASKLNADGSVQFTRPLCEYPRYPHYHGHGDPNNATNFDCVMSAQPQYYKDTGE